MPLLYLGDLFERDEIRDLLSLAAIDAELGGIGLVRVATLPQYGAARSDALAVIRWARVSGVSVIEALGRIAEIEGLSDRGCTGLTRLGKDLAGLAHASPWVLLTAWLFERSDYLQPLVHATDIRSRQKLIAIYHLLKVCAEQMALGDRSRKGFLDRIRHIEVLNQDTPYRAVASEASDIDAVRVMTIHGSKGLEFRAVHLPALATRYLPTIRQSTRCPPPLSLRHLTVRPADHNAEEECLFFVALSRARDYLSLSRAARYTRQNANKSKFLAAIERLLPTTQYSGSGAAFLDPLTLYPPVAQSRYDERHISLYMQCPARYRYEVLERLQGSRDESPYIQFHRCVYLTVHWLEQQREEGRSADQAAALTTLAARWSECGPVGHPFEVFYRKAAESMVIAIVTAMTTEAGQYARQEWAVQVGDRHVVLKPDRVLLPPDGSIHVQRIRTGRETKSESEKPIYALLRRGATASYLGRHVIVETFYLATGNTTTVAGRRDERSLEQYAEAIDGIERGAFESTPEDPRMCPECQCYFMCRT